MEIHETPERADAHASEGYDDLFKRWLLALAELTVCAVLSLLGTIEINHVLSAMEYKGGKAVVVNVLTMLRDTVWETPYFCVLFLFLASVMLFAASLFVKRFRGGGMLSLMLTSTVLFTVCQTVCMYGIITAYAQKTVGGIPYETGLTNVGVIYLIVSVFAVIELALALMAVLKQRKEAALCNDSV